MSGLDFYLQALGQTYGTSRYMAQSQTAADVKKQEGTAKQGEAEKADGKREVTTGRTYGNPKLSKEAEDYYNQLTKKYGNLSFVLVASDRKQEAEAMKNSFATPDGMAVLIDTDKIERMATDKKYRAQMESIIQYASSGMSRMAASVGTKPGVNSYGMSYSKDGRASFFAAVDKSFAEQRKLIEKRAAKKKEDAKAEKKKAAKKADEKRIEKRRADKKEQAEGSDEVVITANSIEELLRKLEDYQMSYLSDHTRTEEEKARGQSVDYSI